MASRNEEVEQINEKPGDGYIGGTGIPWGGERSRTCKRR